MSLPTANDVILDEATVTADVEGESIEIRNTHGVSFQVEWTSTTASATVDVEVSNDGSTWIKEGAQQVINNNSGATMLIITDAYYRNVRVKVEHTSGTVDSVKVTINTKGI